MLKRIVVSLAVLLMAVVLSLALLPGQPAAAQGGGGTNQSTQPSVAPAANPFLSTFVASTPATRVLLNEMTLVWLHDEDYARIIASCAGTGLRNVAPFPNGSIVLIPNAGDLDLAGSTVALKLHPNGQVEFIPRTQKQLIRVPVDIGNKVAGQEVLSLSFAEGMRLMETGHLVWTANNQGPFGNGHGLPGHIATCDPQYPGDDFFASENNNNNNNDNADNNNSNDNDDNDNDDNDNS